MLETLQTAIGHHQAGRLDQAEQLYRQILTKQPEHADALHLLGVVAHQCGRHRQAIELIERALALHPATAAYYTNLVEAYRATGELARAADHARTAVRLQPDAAEAHNNLGLVLQQLGQVEEAIAAFESAVELKPFWPLPFLNLGNLYRELGRSYEAVAIYREGIRLCSEPSLLHNNLGQLLLELGKPEEALLHGQEAVRLRPDQAQAHLNLGNVLGNLGRRQEAQGQYNQAIQLAPNLALPYHQMGLLFQAQGQLNEALGWVQQALQREPDHVTFGCTEANLLYEQDKPDEAVARLRQVLHRHPQHAPAYNSLGYILQDQGDMPGALAAYRQALHFKPEYADAHLNLGLLLSEMGELDEAIAAFRAALQHDPNHPEALAALGLSLRAQLSADETAACERLLAQGRMPGQRRAVLQYGLAQVMDARHQFARAAELAQRANDYFAETARLKGQAFEPAEHRQYVDQIIAAYSPEHFERVRGWGLASELPVFVLGLPRSGTSLVEQMLASHPQVFGAGELSFLRDIYRALPALLGKQAPGIACIGHLERGTVQALAQQYLGRLRQLNAQASRIVDKMPDNYLMFGLIATLLPQARIIHTRRDVRDVGLSCWLTHFRHIHWACNLEHIGVRIQEFQRLMEHWRHVLPGRMLEVDYEEIVAEPEAAARRLVAWCGLDWDPACLAFHQTKRVVRTASMTQVREPIYRRSVDRWRHYQEFLAPLLKILDEPRR